MEHFEKYKYIFKKEESEIVKALTEQRNIVLERDKFVAEFLGIEYPEVVLIVRRISEIAEWKALGRKTKEEEENRNSLVEEGKQKEEMIAMLSKKIAIGIQEEGTSDYGIREIEERVIGILECSINNEHLAYFNGEKKLSRRKNTVTKPIQEEIAETKDVNKEEKERRPIIEARSRECYGDYVLWDIPQYCTAKDINLAVKKFGKVEIKRWVKRAKVKSAIVKIQFHGPEEEKMLESSWSIPIVAGKLTRISKEEDGFLTVKERAQWKAVVTNVPQYAQEVLLLRQLRKFNAKTVFIPVNSNGNPKTSAIVYFENGDDKEKAMESRASYFNTHLYWKQEEKYRTGQRSEDTRDGKGKVLAEADQRIRRQHKEIKNIEKFGKQDRKRWEEQGRKTIIESGKINTVQRRPVGKWKERTREETEEENTVLSSQKLLEEILKRLVRLEERDSIGVTPCHS